MMPNDQLEGPSFMGELGKLIVFLFKTNVRVIYNPGTVRERELILTT